MSEFNEPLEPTPDSPKQTDEPTSDHVPIRQKLAFGLGTANDMWGNWLYPTMVWPVFQMFLHVNPLAISTILMVNRLVDAASDPFFGWLSDNTRTRWGRRRPYILGGSILAGLMMPMLFLVAPDWSQKSYILFMLITSAVFITVVSAFNMPYQSLGNELTPDYNERTRVFAYKGCFQKISEVAGFSFALFATSSLWIGAKFSDAPRILGELFGSLTNWLGDFFVSLFGGRIDELIETVKNPFYWNTGAEGDPNVLLGGQVFSIIIGLSMMVVGVIVFFNVKERYYKKVVESNQEKISLLDTIYKTLKCRPFRAQLAMALSYGLATSMLGTLGYYTTVYYVCGGDIALGSMWNFGMGLGSMFFGLIGVPIFATIANKFGKRRAMMANQWTGIFVFVASWWLYNPEIPWLQFFASGGIAFTQGGFWSIYSSIGADVIDYDELETGKRREGAFSATGTYMMKIGLALGIMLSGAVLTFFGFDSALGGDQDPTALVKIRVAFAGLPIAGLLFAFLALRKFPLSRERMSEIRSALEARRGTV